MRTLILRIIYDNVAFYKEDPGPLKKGQVLPARRYHTPPLAKGELVKWLGTSALGMYQVMHCESQNYEDCNKGRIGYIDSGSIEVYCVYFEREFSTVVISTKRLISLTEKEKIMVANQIATLLTYQTALKSPLELGKEFFEKSIKEIFVLPPPLLPPLKPPGALDIALTKTVRVIYIESILRILTLVANNTPCEDFADIVILLKEKKIFYEIINALDLELFENYPEASFRLLNMLYFADLVKFTGINVSSVPDLLWSQKKKFLRWPTPDNLSLIDEDSIRDLLDKTPKEAEYRTFIFFRMKMREISYLLNSGRKKDIRAMWLDLDLMVDAGIQLLFSNNPTNPYLALWGFRMNDVWNLVRQDVGEPVIKVNGEGNNSWPIEQSPSLKELYKDGKMNESENLLVDKIPVTPIVPEKETVVLNENGLPLSPCEEEKEEKKEEKPAAPPKLKDALKIALRETITAAAGRVFNFIQSDWPAFIQQHPQFIAEFNEVLKKERKSFYDRLSPKVRKSFDDKTTATDLDRQGRKKDVADAISWLDLAYIWYYNLGDEKKLGTEKHPLVFRKNALTTKRIIEHPALKRIYKFIRHRFDHNKTSNFTVFVQYTTEDFYSSVAANDATFNLLGSYTLEIKPVENDEINFRLINNLSLESGSRFRRDDSVKSSVSNKKGVLESVERDADPSQYIKIGGTLRCIWNWNEKISSLPQ